MTTTQFIATANYNGPGASSSDVQNKLSLTVSQHIRHVHLTGAMTYLPYPTNVVGDDGMWLGIVAVFPAATPTVPLPANASQWSQGFWGRPSITAAENLFVTGATTIPARRLYFDVEFDYEPDNGGNAGALYIGYQQMYVDPNHTTPLVSATVQVWGYGA